MSERISFTHRRLESATCATGRNRDFIYDTEERGLCLMITQTGRRASTCIARSKAARNATGSADSRTSPSTPAHGRSGSQRRYCQ